MSLVINRQPLEIFILHMGLFQIVRKMWTKVEDLIRRKAKSVKKCSNLSCLCITSLICLIPLVAVALVIKHQNQYPEYYIIYIDTQDEALFTVSERFLSLGLDSTVITDGFKDFNMTDATLITMMGYLAPAYLRVGGNQADQIVFARHNETSSIMKNGSDAYSLSASDWLKLYNLAQVANINIIYDLNSLLRHEDGSWNSENAESMIEFSQEHSLSVDWELGNEPNSYPHKFGAFVNATQLGIDYHTLRGILNNYSLYENSLLVGPSTTRLSTKSIEEYMLDFLESGSEAVSAITFHHYYFSGENATWQEFLDTKTFDYLEYCINTVLSVVELLPSLIKPLWLGETSTAWHSGAPGLTDRFIGSFLWIDKLGLSAKMGIDAVVRQSIFKGNYALLNNSYYPNPDWWLSVLYKKLVASQVITTETEGYAKIRLYTHCAKPDSLWKNGSTVVVFGVNLSDQIGYAKIKELSSDKNVYAYELTSENSLFSQFVHLNGKLLKLGKDLKLPDFKPKVIERNEILELPPYSIIFWVFTNTNLEVCKP